MLLQSNVITVSDNKASLCWNGIFVSNFHSSEGTVNNNFESVYLRSLLLRKKPLYHLYHSFYDSSLHFTIFYIQFHKTLVFQSIFHPLVIHIRKLL